MVNFLVDEHIFHCYLENNYATEYYMKQEEHQEQCALMQWWAMESRSYGIDERLLYAIPGTIKKAPG